MSDKVIVFVDYQNVYRGARRAFFDDNHLEHHTCGQIDPLRLGRRLIQSRPNGSPARELTQVRVYRGRPSNKRDGKGYAASTRQMAVWAQRPEVEVITRQLQYPREWPNLPPQEKGIDVALAIDFVRLGLDHAYDVGILFSTDNDLKPALEFIAEKHRAWGKPRAEVAAWSNAQARYGPRLSIQSASLWCHWLREDAFTAVKDETDYSAAR